MKKFKICCIFGTRPELIKMAPVIHALQKKQGEVDTHVVCSGQHRELLLPLIKWFQIKVDFNMDLMETNQNLNLLSAKILREFGLLLNQENYDCVIAQGDTTTVLMAAIAAFYAKVPFAHVEGGLRTFDIHLPFPEEMNRVLAGKLAALHFAPTNTTQQNLFREGVKEECVLLTGNTVIDALHYTLRKLGLENSSPQEKIILVTAHRRENFNAPLTRICNALLRVAKQHPQVKIVVPVHPNPNVRITVHNILGNSPNISLVEPLPYEELVALLAQSYLVVTDSGGLQEEAPALKKPVLVLRDETERPEVVALGGAKLVGSDENLIFNSIDMLLTNTTEYQKMVLGHSPYGEGNAAELIVNKIIDYLSHAVQKEERISLNA